MKAVSDKLASVQSIMATNSQHVQELMLMFKDMVFHLEVEEAFKKANAEGEKWEKNNPKTPTEEKDAQNPDQTQGEQHLGDVTMANAQGEQPPTQELSNWTRVQRVWSRCRYDVSNVLDTAYWVFLGVGATFDIFQNIHLLYLQYGVLVFSGYGVLIMGPSWSLDPASGAWNMDTSVSSHLNDSVTSLSDVFNTCIYPSVSVGDGHTIPVTNTGHSILSTPHRPLHLNNVLITPYIVKNLIFVRENNCTVEFGSEVLRLLVSRNLISCNKEKPPVLCHACQLGTHVRLPLVSSNTSVTSRFDIVHSDVWTSPIPSLSGFKYYVLFLDHYSHFVWVYPLVNKLDVLSKFMLFRTYVNTQFKCEIKSFQCDHGGEFDNRALHTLFASKVFPYGSIQSTSAPSYTFLDGSPDIITQTIHFAPGAPPTVLQPEVKPTTPTPHNTPIDTLNHTSPNSPYTPAQSPTAAQTSQQQPIAQPSPTPLTAQHQPKGVDVDETFNPVVKPGTIWTILSLATSRHWPIHQFDVKNAFLHGDLSETVYMHQPPGFQDSVHPDYVCLLHRSLYGLKWLSSLHGTYTALIDNVNAVYLSSNPVQHQCTKHIEIDIHFVRDLVVVGQVRVLHVPSRYQLEEKLTNTESNWYRVLLRFSILVLEINSLIFTSSISSSIPSIQQQQQQQQQMKRLENTKAAVEFEDLLIRCIAQRLEPSNYRLVAACFIYKSSETTVGERVEAKNPALLFKHQLTTYVEKIYEMIRENLKEELVPLVHTCSQAARGAPKNNIPIRYYWQQIVENILDFLKILDSNNCLQFFQFFCFALSHLLHSIQISMVQFSLVPSYSNYFLVRRECCSFDHGEYIKEGLSELKSWCHQATEKYAGSAWDELKHTRQAIEFLVSKRKARMTLDAIIHDLCPALNIQQLYKISTMYRDDIYNTPGVSPDVISKLREDSYANDSESFLLDEDLNIPFSVDDLSKSMDQINIANIEPPPLIRDHSGFNFLSQSL
ncbi:ribonuclease H-like domain-containing protein [Tanacetum coccineum]